MIRRGLAFLFLLSAASAALWCQDEPTLRLTVVPRILDAQVQVIWEQTLEQETHAGKPVVVNIEAGTLKVRLTLTPYAAPDGNYLLVVQGLVRQSDSDSRSFRTSVQSVLIPAGEKVVYFPLGRDRAGSNHQMVIEMQIDQVIP